MILYFANIPESVEDVYQNGIYTEYDEDEPIILALSGEGAAQRAIYTLGLENMLFVEMNVYSIEVPSDCEKYLSFALSKNSQLQGYIYLAFWGDIPPEWVLGYTPATATAIE